MAKYTATLSSNTSAYLFSIHKPRDYDDCTFTVMASGTFGGGTVKVQISPDGGTTKIDLAPISGSIPAITASSAYTFKTGVGHKNGEEPQIYVTISGATGPSVSVVAYDNN